MMDQEMKTSPPRDWRERLGQQWWSVKMMERLQGLDMGDRRNKIVTRLVRKTQNGTLGQPTDEPEDEDVSSYKVGDEIHNHYSPPPPDNRARDLLLAAIAGLGLGAGAMYLNKPDPGPDKDSRVEFSLGPNASPPAPAE